MKTITLILLGTGLFMAAVQSNAATLASYTFEYATDAADAWKASGVVSSLTASDISFGNATLQSGTSIAHTTSDTTGWYAKVQSSVLTDNSTTAKNNNNYIELTITAASGSTFSVTALSFDGQIQGAGLYIYTGVYISTDGVNFGDRLTGPTLNPSNASTLTSFTAGNLGSLDNLTRVTLRLYFHAINKAETRYFYLDNLKIEGSVSQSGVPESSTWAVIAGGVCLGLVLVWRRFCF